MPWSSDEDECKPEDICSDVYDKLSTFVSSAEMFKANGYCYLGTKKIDDSMGKDEIVSTIEEYVKSLL